MIRQLNVPLRTLVPNRRVYIVRNGLVYQYPARIVRDMANDMWVGPEDDTFEPIADDWSYGKIVSDQFSRGTNRAELAVLCRMAWTRFADPKAFDWWWDSVITDSDAYLVGASATSAARNVMTWSLFVHRNEVDTSGLGA